MKRKYIFPVWTGIVGIIFLILLAFPNTGTDNSKDMQGEIGTAVSIDHRSEILDKFFNDRGMPLAGYGQDFVSAADKYGIDWTLLPAISIIESTGGKKACGNNPFGWGSCRSGNFASIAEAIDYVSKNLGGQNPRTRSAYSGGLDDDLHSYNGTVDPTYPQKVKEIMSAIKAGPLP